MPSKPDPGERNRPPTVLILEDEVLIALDIGAIVQSVGWHVIGPINHLEPALQIAERGDLDGAVLDIHLNGDSTSYPVAAALENRRIPFIFVTGIDKGGMAQLFPQAAVVRKPYNEVRLRDAIKSMLDKALKDHQVTRGR